MTAWHAAARALMALADCPELRMHTVSEGYPVHTCGGCGAVVSEEEAEGENCPHCGAGDFPDDWIPEQSHPDADVIPALDDSPAGLGNVGGIAAVIAERCGKPEAAEPGDMWWMVEADIAGPERWCVRLCRFRQDAPGCTREGASIDSEASTMAHAYGLALLAMDAEALALAFLEAS